MEWRGWMGGLYHILEWLMRLAYVNLLWIFFTLVGLVLFGFAPATAAMFQVVRKWVRGEEDFPVFEAFWKTCRSEFFSANLLFWIIGLIGFILYIDFHFFGSLKGTIFQWIQFVVLGFVLMYLIVMMYVFPVFVHYELKILQVIKYAWILGITHPVHTVMMGVGGISILFILGIFPWLIPFFSGSGLSLLWMWWAHRVFCKVELK